MKRKIEMYEKVIKKQVRNKGKPDFIEMNKDVTSPSRGPRFNSNIRDKSRAGCSTSMSQTLKESQQRFQKLQDRHDFELKAAAALDRIKFYPKTNEAATRSTVKHEHNALKNSLAGPVAGDVVGSLSRIAQKRSSLR